MPNPLSNNENGGDRICGLKRLGRKKFLVK